MDELTQQKLAESLTAASTGLLPFLPYLLQDFYELGSSPKDMVRLTRRYVPDHAGKKVLDLGCGKGAVSVNMAKELGMGVLGVDLIPEFLETAREKARKFGVSERCRFQLGNIREIVGEERDRDCVILGTGCGVLGAPAQTLQALRGVLCLGGVLLLDDAYTREGRDPSLQKCKGQYPTLPQWEALFTRSGFELMGMEAYPDPEDSGEEMRQIARRAEELTQRHPEYADLFASYIQSQRDEYDDLKHQLVSATWILRAT